MVRFYLVLLLFLVLPDKQVLAQAPEHDDCAGARFLVLDNNGNLCFNDTNLQATGDGLFTNCDMNVLPPLPLGGHELWYTFVTAGDSYTITVTPTGTPAAERVSVAVLNGNCSSGLGIAGCNNAVFPGDPISATFNSPPGTQVWFNVTALDFDGIYTVCITSENNPVTPGADCNTAPIICNTNNFSSPGRTTLNTSVVPTCFNSPPVSALWYRFTAGYTGPLEFSGFPNGAFGFRWALFDISGGCPGTEIACNSVYAPSAPFGLSAAAANCTASPLCPPVNVVAGNEYALMVDDTSRSGAGFDFNWGDNAVMMPNPLFTVDSTTACGSLLADFTNTSSFSPTTLWSFNYGDGSPPMNGTGATFNIPSHNYTVPGTYLATLTVSSPNGCNRSFSREIRIRPKPSSLFTNTNSPICFDGSTPANGTFQAAYSSNSATYSWSFPGSTTLNAPAPGSANASWTTSGPKPVELVISERGCVSDTTRDTVEVFDGPSGFITVSNTGCTGVPLTAVYGGGNTPNAFFLLDFGGAAISAPGTNQIDLTWNSSGIYTVSVTVIENGCSSSPVLQDITIMNSPQISVTAPATVCEGETTTITPLASGAPASAQYTWDFGTATLTGGNPANGSSATLNWPVPGNSYIIGIATDISGCPSAPDTAFVTVIAKPTPSISLSSDTICDGDTLTVTYNGATPTGGSRFYWDFVGSSVLNPTTNAWGPYQIQPGSQGANIIRMMMERSSCLSDTIMDTVYVNAPPIADAGANQTVCAGTSITTGAPAVPGNQYLWSPISYFDDPTSATAQALILHTGTADTTVVLSVRVENAGCIAYDTTAVTITPVQQAYFIPPDPQCEDGNSFDFSPYYGIVAGASFEWDIDGSISTLPTVNNFSFPSDGGYTVSLQTQTPGCGASSYTTNVVVKPTPQVSFTTDITSGCVPLTVNFQDQNTPLPGATYRWDFGNSVVSFNASPSFTYSTAGQYSPSLTITSADTCPATVSGIVSINAFGPVPAVFTAEPMIASENNPTITFTALSASSGCIIDFGDNTSDSACSVSHTYPGPGRYTVTLVTTGPGDCNDTSRLEVEIKASFSLYLPSAFTPNEDGINDRFEIFSEGIETFEMKIFNVRGQLVWETTETDDTWNGRFLNTGEECPSGVYVFEAKVMDINRKKHNQRGRITIVR